MKPVQGSDGSRVPLLRAGFRPSGVYTVSFVYLGSGAPFAKRGAYELAAAKLDVPVNLMTWEVFLPERLEVKQLAGNALAATLFPARPQNVFASDGDEYNEADQNIWIESSLDIGRLEAGQIGGIVADRQGAVITGALVTVVNTQTGVTQTTASNMEGRWIVSDVHQGPVRIRVDANGFRSYQQEMNFEPTRPARLGVTLEVGQVTETVTVTSGRDDSEREVRRVEEQARKAQEARMNLPSQNVFSLQRRVAGILPVRVDVPRAGKSYRFVRPLVIGEDTKITFQYRSR